MTDRLLVGPFLTRDEAAELAHLNAGDVPFRPDLIRIGGRLLPEAYCRFQFGSAGVRADIGTVVLAMRGEFDDLTIANWLASSNPELRWSSPLEYLNLTHEPAPVLDALLRHPPQPATDAGPSILAAAPTPRTRTEARRQPRFRTRRIGRPAPSH